MKIIDLKTAKKYAGKTALVRIDLNIDSKSELFRLEAILPTINLLLKNKVKVVLLSHRGRPRLNSKSEIPNSKQDKSLSLDVFAPIISKRLKMPVDFIAVYRMGGLRAAILTSDAKVVLVENLRFFNGEEANDPSFAKALAECGGFYVNDAFAVSHRENASVTQLPNFLPSYAGLNFAEEIKNLSGVMKAPKKPVVLIIGGAKISDKLGVIKNFWNKADSVLLGGGPANTALEIFGFPMGKSITDAGARAEFKDLAFSPKIYVPQDLEVSTDRILDIGPKTTKEYAGIISKAGTIIWNGPMGWFENKKFRKGTEMIWKAILKNKKAKIIVGGGETIASRKLISNFQFSISKQKRLFVSTGGGAMLQFLSGKKLPGLEALNR
jgi:phosphoglycerate kinase